MKRIKRTISIFIIGLGLDLFLKSWTLKNIASGKPITVISDFFGLHFSLSFVKNTGMAYGYLSSHPHLLLVLRLVLIAALILYLVGSRSQRLALALVLTGAVGNVLDHFLYGYVVDMVFISFRGLAPFGVFNLADFFICTGITMLTLQMFFRKKSVSPLSA